MILEKHDGAHEMLHASRVIVVAQPDDGHLGQRKMKRKTQEKKKKTKRKQQLLSVRASGRIHGEMNARPDLSLGRSAAAWTRSSWCLCWVKEKEPKWNVFFFFSSLSFSFCILDWKKG